MTTILIFILVGCGACILGVISWMIYCIVSKKPFTSMALFVYRVPFFFLFWTSVITSIIVNYDKFNIPVPATVPETMIKSVNYISKVKDIEGIEYIMLSSLAVWIFGATLIRSLMGAKAINLFNVIKILTYSVSAIFLFETKELLYTTFSIYIVVLWITAIFFARLSFAIRKAKYERREYYKMMYEQENKSVAEKPKEEKPKEEKPKEEKPRVEKSDGEKKSTEEPIVRFQDDDFNPFKGQ